MLDAVFISDLHLHPYEPNILERFKQFVAWARTHTRSVYILGDFFHAWSGDDAAEEWSKDVVTQLRELTLSNIPVYFLPGNRDFLVGKEFAAKSGITLLSEPAFVYLGKQTMLVHGDRYCTLDKSHQWLRRITRNRWFPFLFLHLPCSWRKKLVNKMRYRSQIKRAPLSRLDVVPKALLTHMEQQEVKLVIHGHTHKPAFATYFYNKKLYNQYVLSDWEENPVILSYNIQNGVHFVHLS